MPSLKGMFLLISFAISERYVEMLTKVVNITNLYMLFGTFFPFNKAEHYGERIIEIGCKLRKLWHMFV